MDSVWQLSINRWQKVLRMNRVWWNCCIEKRGLKSGLAVSINKFAGHAKRPF
jgi:hypothetical protein